MQEEDKNIRIAGLKSIKQLMQPGIYAYCSCGWSSNQPFCDGSHYGTGMKPIMVHIDHPAKISWCTCKHSQKGNICDGTHKKLREEMEQLNASQLP